MRSPESEETDVRGIESKESIRLYERARRVAPGGIQGAARFWEPEPAPSPRYFARCEGGHIWDVDGNEFVDLWAAAGPILLGHNDRRVVDPLIRSIAERGINFCLPHEGEVELAEELCAVVPSAEMVVYGCGGSDVCLFALRAARVFTGRQKFVKCEGAYHGWNDPFLVSAWPGLEGSGPEEAPVGISDSLGLSASTVEDCLVVPFNDVEAVERALAAHRGEIAAMFVEPILHTAGCIPPADGYLQAVRELCTAEGIVLVFDEILSGFRHDLGGYQSIVGVTPDLTTLGKAMSNGFPISALVGRDEIMSTLSPTGRAYYSGTFMGHMFMVEGALQTLRVLKDRSIYDHLFALGDTLAEIVTAAIAKLNVNACFQHYGSLWSLYFGTRSVTSYRDVARIGHPKDKVSRAFRGHLMANGYYFHPPTRRGYFMDAHRLDEAERLGGVIERFLVEHRAQLKGL